MTGVRIVLVVSFDAVGVRLWIRLIDGPANVEMPTVSFYFPNIIGLSN